MTYHYKYTVEHLRDGFKYCGAVDSYDVGTRSIESLESRLGAERGRCSCRAPRRASAAGHGVTVFPNPYRVEAAWDAGQQARDHYLWFANLPQQCSIQIYTLSGDLIYETDFDGTHVRRPQRARHLPPRSDLPDDPLGHDVRAGT